MDIIEATNTSRIEGMRLLVSVGYNSTDLPDSDITNDVFLGESNRYVKRRVPNWENLIGDDRESLEVCVSKKTAAEMLKSVARTLEINRGSARARMSILSIKDTIMEYEQDVEDIIRDISPEDSEDAVPYFEVIEI